MVTNYILQTTLNLFLNLRTCHSLLIYYCFVDCYYTAKSFGITEVVDPNSYKEPVVQVDCSSHYKIFNLTFSNNLIIVVIYDYQKYAARSQIACVFQRNEFVLNISIYTMQIYTNANKL
jgi:hypothetical protein